MSWFSILLVLSLAWLFGDLFRFLFALLGIILGPILLAALITSMIPQIPVGVAYFGVLIFMLLATWKVLPPNKNGPTQRQKLDPPIFL